MEYYKKRPFRKRALQLFLLSFSMYMVAVLPFFIERGMPFFYYGDYNVQQIPFYTVAHRAVRSGNLFYLWNVDFGSSLIGSFSFYLLGSPFFWLTVPFPESFIPYMMPFLMALKYSVCSITAYAYIRRKVIRDDSAMIGALLYAFSGFNACNIVFNHFTDVVAFFPLYLLTFDRLMEIDHHKDLWIFKLGKKRFIQFTLMTAYMAVINYYFFFGEVIFLILYFVICYIPGNSLRTNIRMFLRALAGGILGVMVPAFYVLQAVMGVAGNNRLNNILIGYDVVSYSSMNMLWDILKSMVMIPDIIGKGTVFYTSPVKNASLAVFLPLFGLSGVIAYCLMKKKSVYRRLMLVCLVFALIPGLNAVFSLMNESYYARWFYMPILFMSLLTAKAIERGKSRELKIGTLTTCGLFIIILGISLLPSYNDYHEVVNFGLIQNEKIYWRDVIGTAIMMIMLIVSVFVVPKCVRRIKLPFSSGEGIELKRPIMRLEVLFIFTAIASIISLHIVLKNGSGLITDFGKEQWQAQMIDSSPDLPEDNDFFRTETDNTATNYDMFWGYGSLHSFISTIPAPTFDFLYGTGEIDRTVETRIPEFNIGLRAILSQKYYFENSLINEEGIFKTGNGIQGFYLYDSQNGIDIYQNLNYIPMGFTYDYCIRESDFEAIDDIEIKDHLLSVAVVLSDDDVDKYSEFLKELPEAYYTEPLAFDVFVNNCEERRNSACQKFETDTKGFYAMTSNVNSDKLLFFSVPNMKGFTVKIDGKKTEIINADYGMMAIKLSPGVHEIRADYIPAGFFEGFIISIIGIVLLCIYVAICHFYKNR
ncbi:YfhO family protein [Butyrivibrio sp. VCD2006]|uniref:YfhO family protein n=1 Tax=Butyrivibrio sp. VCD2006 TaxID=1280664 RepID=UPI00047D9DA5|nr:YfhO family protein [Butyrivibrio sp. VCD2006]